VPERFAFDYAVVRVVPRVDRGEFLNAGVIVFCPTRGYLESRIELDHARLQALAPSIDLAVVESYLEAIPKVCAGGGEAGSVGSLPQRARFHWLVAPRSTVIQTSAVHSGVHHDPKAALESLFEKLVRPPKEE
jgi:molybdopterin-guanine dinucleotide biosynthesis protein